MQRFPEITHRQNHLHNLRVEAGLAPARPMLDRTRRESTERVQEGVYALPHCTQTQLCPPPGDTRTGGHKVKEERILLAGHVHILVLRDLLNHLQMLSDDL